MKKTISLNSFIVAKIDGTISNYPHLEKKKLYVLIDLIIRHSKYNEGMHAYLMAEILRRQLFLGAFVKFIVNEDGKLENIQIINKDKISDSIEERIIHVVLSFPKWSSGKIMEAAVSSSQFIAISEPY